MIGVALEGGGARGAYHVGAIKALYEAGYAFDGYVGTSIGAINAAVLAQGDFDQLERMWRSVTPEMLFSDPLVKLLKLGERSFGGDFVADVRGLIGELRQTGLHKGVDTTRMKAMIAELIDEARLRASGKVYGLVTVSVTEFKPYQLLLQDIPEGMLHDYVMASASFPGFQPQVIGEHSFLDGGLYNNCPINMLTDLGFDEVIAIRTGGPGLFFPPQTEAKVTIISPSRDLGNVMSFDNEQALRSLSVGYLDALKMLRSLKGRSYYVEPWQKLDAVQRFLALPDSLIADMRSAFALPDLPPKRLLFERILPELGTHLKLERNYDYEDLLLALIESAAADAGVDPLRVFGLSELSQAILDVGEPAPGKERPLAILSHLLDRRQPLVRQLGRLLAQVVRE